MTSPDKTHSKTLALAAALTLLVAVFGGLYATGHSETNTDTTSFTVEVIHKDGQIREFELRSDADNLEEALLEEQLIEGTPSQFGLYVTSVDGESANWGTDQSWWKLSVNGSDASTGASQITLEDGAVYTWSYENG